MSRYSTISVPIELHEELRRMVREKPRLGYTSVAEFCKEAIRLHVSHIRMERKEALLQQIDLDDVIKKIDLLSSITGGIYRSIFEELQDAIFYIAPSGRIINCNERLIDQLGYAKKEELLDEDLSIIFASEREMNALMNEVKARGSIKDYEVSLKRKDGKILHFLLSVGEVKENGRIIGYHGVGKDITVRKIAEERLKKSRNLYYSIINELYDSIAVLQDGKIKFISACATISGYSPEELQGKKFLDMIAPEDRKRAEENHRKRMKGEKVPSIVKYKILAKDGSIIETEVLAKMIEYEGRPAALCALRALDKES